MFIANKRDQSVENVQDVVGVGFKWPPEIGKDGCVVIASVTAHIRSCIHRIIMYCKGHLAGIYSFGGGLFGDIFSVSAASRFRLREKEITQAVTDFEDRVTNTVTTIGTKAEETQSSSPTASQTTMYCSVLYQVLYTNEDGDVLVPLLEE